ncbi:hypothetical protein HKD37_10G028237 [Glycine soja]
MKGNCLLISLNGHGDSEGDIFILGIPDVCNEYKNSGGNNAKAGLSNSSDLSILSALLLSINLECAVRLPGNSNEAIPLEATVQTIPPLECIPDDKVVQTNVLPVPPYP